MQDLIDEIVQREWDFFQLVHNQGGRASCQNDRQTFTIMRASQMGALSMDVCTSYLMDLKQAQAEGINPLACKYAYMALCAHPEDAKTLSPLLPPLSDETIALSEKIMGYILGWAEAYARLYPLLATQGRPLHAGKVDDLIVSSETYFRGELWTYSQRTLQSLLSYAQALSQKNENLVLKVMERTVCAYGYSSLPYAEAALAAKAGAGPSLV